MPYARNDDLPPAVHDHLPTHAQDIFREAFNNAGDEAAAFRIAWAAVKQSYIKHRNRWQPRV